MLQQTSNFCEETPCFFQIWCCDDCFFSFDLGFGISGGFWYSEQKFPQDQFTPATLGKNSITIENTPFVETYSISLAVWSPFASPKKLRPKIPTNENKRSCFQGPSKNVHVKNVQDFIGREIKVSVSPNLFSRTSNHCRGVTQVCHSYLKHKR